ncbi:MAG: hypothetical protein JNM17_04095 [Archangium sp.]|nr:hypothetical protein [Archangium sp.]
MSTILYVVKNGSVVHLSSKGERVTSKVGDEIELTEKMAKKMDPTGHYLKRAGEEEEPAAEETDSKPKTKKKGAKGKKPKAGESEPEGGEEEEPAAEETDETPQQ